LENRTELMDDLRRSGVPNAVDGVGDDSRKDEEDREKAVISRESDREDWPGSVPVGDEE
jgi:hypothetical protein